MNTPSAIAQMISDTLKSHKGSRDMLADAITTILTPLPNGTVIKTASHTVECRKVFCGCSQWSNRRWDVTGKEDGYIVDGALIGDVDPSIWDGSNWHYRRTGLYLSRDGDGSTLKLATAKTLRSLSRELGEGVAAYVAGKKADTLETVAATAALFV